MKAHRGDVATFLRLCGSFSAHLTGDSPHLSYNIPEEERFVTALRQRINNAQQRLIRLRGAWGRKTLKIEFIHHILAGFGPAGSLSPARFLRLTKLLKDVAALRSRERDILSKIQSVEEKHRRLRQSKKLRNATPSPTKRITIPEVEEEPVKPRSQLWLALIALWLLGTRKRTVTKQRLDAS